jgi:cyclin-dependent kinase 12/13
MGCVHGRPSASSPDRPQPPPEPAPAAAVAVQESAVKPEQPAAAVEKPARKVKRSRSSRPAPGPGSSSFANRARGEQVAAGWPAWLSAVAGEAIDGWTPRRADSFEKIDKVRTRALSFPFALRRSMSATGAKELSKKSSHVSGLRRSGRARTATCTRRGTR